MTFNNHISVRLLNIFAILMLSLLCSCSSTQTVTISGKPGTKIYNLEKQELGTVPHSGKLQLKISNDKYSELYLSKQQSDETYVPFGFDYKHNAHHGTYFLRGLGYFTCFAGLGVCVTGAIIGAGPIAGIGGGAALLGIVIGAPNTMKTAQTAYKYQYEYLTSQNSNSDIRFVKPQIQYKEPTTTIESVSDNSSSVSTITTSRKLKSSEQTNTPTAPPSSNSKGNKVRHSLKNDIPDRILGTYSGSGIIGTNETVLEKLDNIKVIIRKSNVSSVSVRIIEADGNSFFDAPLTFKAKSNLNGNVTLVESPSSTIEINDNQLKLTIENLEIDDLTTGLRVTAKKVD